MAHAGARIEKVNILNGSPATEYSTGSLGVMLLPSKMWENSHFPAGFPGRDAYFPSPTPDIISLFP